MSYIGNQPTTVAFLTDQFSGNGSTTAFTMSVAPATTSSILVAITGVVQDPSTYSVVGTTLTFSAAPPSGTGNISVRYLGIPASGVTTTAYRTVTEFTATASQTTFSVPSYTVGYINVYRNGVRLGTADFTASSGTSVVLATACTAGDLVMTESFYVSSVLNALPTTGGSLSGQLTINSQTGQTPFVAQVNGTEALRVTSSGATILSAVGSEGGELELLNPGNGSVGMYIDVGGTDGGRIFGIRDNFSLQIGQLAGTGGLVDFFTAGQFRGRFDSTGNFQFNSGYGSVATAYGCRAWVNFNGTGTVAIRASGNVSSITDNGTGNYTVNFTSAMPDTNYAFTFGGTDSIGDNAFPNFDTGQNGTVSTTQLQVRSDYQGTLYDMVRVCVSIFR